MRILLLLFVLCAFNSCFGLRMNPFTNSIKKSLKAACSLLMANDFHHPTPDFNDLSLILLTKCKRTSYKFSEITELVKDPEFNPKYSTYMFVHGWINTAEISRGIETLRRAFLCHGEINFIIVDMHLYMELLYTWAAANTKVIGIYLGEALNTLFTAHPELLKDFHLTGHSLGAQITGWAARTFKEKYSKPLPIIVVFDPANPCFDHNGKGISSVSKSDAGFVVIIHCNIDVLGEHGPDGTIDIYPSGEDSFMPGCSFFKLPPLMDPSCSHHLCINYFAEPFYKGNENNLIANKCKNLEELGNKECKGEELILGNNIPRNAEGIYYLSVNPSEPYGENASNKLFNSKNLKCYECPNPQEESSKDIDENFMSGLSLFMM